MKQNFDQQDIEEAGSTIKFSSPHIEDIPKISEDDITNFESNYKMNKLFEGLNRLLKDSFDKESKQSEEISQFSVLDSYVRRNCPYQGCEFKNNPSLQCSNCILDLNKICWIINDDTVIYIIINNNQIIIAAQDFLTLKQYLPPLQDDELAAIFYFHRKFLSVTPEYKKIKNIIYYDNPVKLIHYNLAKLLVHKYHTTSVLAKNNTDFAMFRDYTKEFNVVFNHHFKISREDMDGKSKLSNTFRWVYNSYLSEINKSPKPFYNLRRVLFYISSGDTNVIDNLAILLLKVYIGRSYLHYLDNDKRNLTVCICNNKNYIKNFMMHIFNFTMESDKTKLINVGVDNTLELFFRSRSEKSFYHMSTYSSKMLSDDKYLGALIRDKLCGNIVNLDTTETFGINGKFKSFLSGEKVSVIDPVFGKISYRSNAQYIYITEDKNLPESSFSGVPHSILHFTGGLSEYKRNPLDEYELFFLVTGFLHYALDLIDAPSNNETDSFQSSTAVPSIPKLIDTFIDQFCDDTTRTISNRLIQNIPFDSINGSKNEKERKEQVKKLQIDKLDFIFSEDLRSCFNKWLHVTHPTVESCSDGDFTKMIIEKYHIIFYNKSYNENMSGKKQEARGFYGLKIKVDELEKSLSQENQKKMAVSREESEKHFTRYLENIISNYYKFQI